MASSIKSDFDEPSRELFINNLPDGISETGIRKLFIHYGKTLNIRKLNQESAIIKFSNKNEAESAFNNLNGTKPLCLKINYLIEDYEQENGSTNLTSPEDKNIDLIVGKYYELRKKLANNKCSHCENLAYYNCRNCQEFYCSQICQQNAWAKHQKFCTGSKVQKVSSTPTSKDVQSQLKSLNQSHSQHQTLQTNSYNNKRLYKNEKINESNNQNTQTSFKNQDSNSEIVITHFKDPNIVYFRSNAPLFIQMYKAMIKKVHEHCLRSTKPILPITANHVFGCIYEGNWYRAKIIDVKNDKILINYIDFGNENIVDLDSLRKLDSELIKLVPNSIMIKKLHNIKELNIKARTLLAEWVDSEQPLKIKEYDGNFIDIFTSDGKNIKHLIEEQSLPPEPKNSSMLKKTCSKQEETFQKTSSPISSTECLINGEVNAVPTDRIMYPDLKYSTLNIGDQFKLILFYQYDKNIYQFGAQVSDALTNVYNLTSDFSAYCEKSEETEYHPCENEVILVKLSDDESWYRAYCLAYHPDSDLFDVNFLDFGNVIKVKPSEIRKIPRKFIEPEIIGMTFAVKGCPEDLFGDRLSRFKDVFKINNTYDVTLTHKDNDTDIYTFKFNDLDDELKPIFEQK